MNFMEIIKDEKFPLDQYVPQILDVTTAIADGMAFMHKKDIVKPTSNLDSL